MSSPCDGCWTSLCQLRGTPPTPECPKHSNVMLAERRRLEVEAEAKSRPDKPAANLASNEAPLNPEGSPQALAAFLARRNFEIGPQMEDALHHEIRVARFQDSEKTLTQPVAAFPGGRRTTGDDVLVELRALLSRLGSPLSAGMKEALCHAIRSAWRAGQ